MRGSSQEWVRARLTSFTLCPQPTPRYAGGCRGGGTAPRVEVEVGGLVGHSVLSGCPVCPLPGAGSHHGARRLVFRLQLPPLEPLLSDGVLIWSNWLQFTLPYYWVAISV